MAVPSALCAALLLGAGLFSGSLRQQELSSGQTDESAAVEFAQDRIVLNTVNSLSADKINVTLSPDDFVAMDAAGLNEYYGMDIFPTIPADLAAWEQEDGYGIYRRENGTGAVYWDQVVLNYSNEDFSRNISLEAAKGGLPSVDCAVLSDGAETSRISGTDVCLFFCDLSGIYQAQFVSRDTGFVLTADGLSQDEVISVIRSLVE